MLLVTVHLTNVLESANEDILATMRVTVARILHEELLGGSRTVPESVRWIAYYTSIQFRFQCFPTNCKLVWTDLSDELN